MVRPYVLGVSTPIVLDPNVLPYYALRTVSRLFIALGFSLLFTLVVGAFAAKNKRAERLIIPAIDVLQSVPVLSFLAISITGFIHFFPHSLLGPECASLFVIFTAQVWNMTFGLYQSLKRVPNDLREAAAMFQLSRWQYFWKVEVPFAMPSLLWNAMMSMSASWFFVVLSEALVVANQDIRLPGIGSYIALAIERHDLTAIGYAMLTMVVVIFLYDQLLFRTLMAWSEKFKADPSIEGEEAQSWMIDLLRRSRLMKQVHWGLGVLKDKFINGFSRPRQGILLMRVVNSAREQRIDWLFGVLVGTLSLVGATVLIKYILSMIPIQDIIHVFWLGALTGTRVIVLIFLSSLVWIPVGVWIGMRPRFAQKIQPAIQFLAAFPANLVYPLFVIAIVRFHLSVEIWVTPLMILGTQWYILFNVIAGASMIPRDLCLVADNFGVRRWQWWRKLALPGIFPYFITGAITAAGGAWNASIVAEWVSWGSTTLKATGLGAYIQESTMAGDFPKIALGTAMMCVYVLFFNHMLWRPLYRLADQRYHCA